MTITLHWWMIPLAIAGAGVWVGAQPCRDYGDIMNPIICMGLLALAVAFCLGHLLA